MILLIKTPPKSKSNPLGLKGSNMGIFFKQKITKEVIKKAIKGKHIILVN